MSTRSIALNALKMNGDLIATTLSGYQDDKEAILIAIKNNGTNIKYASTTLKNDMEVIKAAVKQNEKAYYNLPISIKKDMDVFVELVRINANILRVANDFTREEMFEIYRRIDKEFTPDEKISLKARMTEKQRKMLFVANRKNLLEGYL